ncbi:makorin, ring finger protein, 4 [Clinocottus analis]|uniref:makorin, ring finger protein, 4 n=1 Tax=Clinocottus analis TaxID=304258 RepID=UPI0035BF2EFE
MERVRRLALRTPRMDAVSGRGICRRFSNGYCRFGSRCAYRHDCPVVPQSQICRYFQKSGCWYGDHCRYLHVQQLDVDAAVAGRRGSMPTVSSRVTNGPTGRRGSEPALLQAELQSRPECNGSSVNVSNPQQGLRLLTADIAEEQSQDTDTPIAASWESLHSSEVAQACVGRNEQETSNERMEDGLAAAASTSQRTQEETEAFLQSKDVTCGICFDKVYDNADPKKHVFGILPNCNHSFCLQCIMTWRKTKDHGPESVKRCPHCRVRSAFYMPSEHWVEGQAKESVIAAFKEKFRLKSCSYYTRFRHCPFKTECLYRHDKYTAVRHYKEDDDYDGVDLLHLFIAMTLLGDDDDDVGLPFYLSEEYGS